MKIGLLGDIHGNASALEAVLDAVRKTSTEKLLITGDFVGYYFEPKKVLDLLSTWDYVAVRGNHEEMLSRARLDSDYLAAIDRRYGSGVRLALEQLSDNEIDRLCSLPHPLSLTIGAQKILLCHGAPHDINMYFYPDSDLSILDQQALSKFDLIVTGHTHYPMSQSLSGHTMLVNPGSVGQPRNRQPGAHWALYDSDSQKIIFHVEKYNYKILQETVRLTHPKHPYLADVLGRV